MKQTRSPRYEETLQQILSCRLTTDQKLETVYNLFNMVQSGDLDGLPVQEDSLSIQGLTNRTWPKLKRRTNQLLQPG